MRFNACRCKACKAVAVGAAGLFAATYIYLTAYGDECWDRPQVRLYCQSFVPEQPHTHRDQGSINWVQSLATVASSSSNNTLVFVNKSNGVINFVNGSGGEIVWQVG